MGAHQAEPTSQGGQRSPAAHTPHPAVGSKEGAAAEGSIRTPRPARAKGDLGARAGTNARTWAVGGGWGRSGERGGEKADVLGTGARVPPRAERVLPEGQGLGVEHGGCRAAVPRCPEGSERVQGDLAYFSNGTTRPSAGSAAGLLLAASNRTQDRDELGEKPRNRRHQDVVIVEHSKPRSMAHGAKMRNWLLSVVRKAGVHNPGLRLTKREGQSVTSHPGPDEDGGVLPLTPRDPGEPMRVLRASHRGREHFAGPASCAPERARVDSQPEPA